VVFVPQRIADSDNIRPRRVGITRPQFLRQGARRFGNNLDRAFRDAAKTVALPIDLEALAPESFERLSISSRI
jgi:hypothetical protein